MRTLSLALAAAALIAAPARGDVLDGEDGPRPWLGIGFEDGGSSARVTEVHPNTAASLAGLLPGDEIVAIDGESLIGANLVPLIKERSIGDRMRITFYRGGRIVTVAPRLTQRPTTDEIVYRRMIDHVPPAVPVYDREGLPVPAADVTRGSQTWVVFDAACDACAAHAADLRERLAEDGLRTPLRVVLVGGADEAAAYLARVPVIGTVWRMDRFDATDPMPYGGFSMRPSPLGIRFLSGVERDRDGVVLVLDRQGVVRFATSLSAGEAAHDGACAAAARLTRSWRR